MQKDKIPSIPSYKFGGHLKNYIRNPLAFLERHSKNKDIFKFRIAHRNLIVINHPDYVKHVLQENHTNYRKNLAYKKLKLLLGNGLFTSEGDYWLKQRRLAQPAFHKEKISNSFDTMKDYTEVVVNRWKNCIKSNEEILVHKEMTDLTLKIICKTLLGIDLSNEGKVVEENLPYTLDFMIRRVTSVVNFPMVLPLKKHLSLRSPCLG